MKTGLTLMRAAFAAMTIWAGDLNAERRAADKPKEKLTCEQIVALPRRQTRKVAMPSDAQGRIYIGSGVYKHGKGQMNNGGFCFTTWAVDRLKLDEIVELCDKEQVGNTLQFWLGAKDILEFGAKAKSLGIYSTCIYSSGKPEETARLIPELGDHWLGYDFGERYSFAITQDFGDRGASLRDLAAEYMGRVHTHVIERQQAGWGNIQATSANFSIDYEIAAGAEVKDVGMVGYLYQYAAKLGRGNVFITGPDFENPDEDCGWILYSYLPGRGQGLYAEPRLRTRAQVRPPAVRRQGLHHPEAGRVPHCRVGQA